MCDLGSEDSATLWNRKKVKARVARKCLCCGLPISPGDSYERTNSLYDGSWTTEWSCALCAAAIETFGKAHRFYPSASSFPEFLDECVQYDGATTWVEAQVALNARRAQAKL